MKLQVFSRQDQSATPRWREYQLIGDDLVIVVSLRPELMGWNVTSWMKQGSESWGGMTQAAIIAFKDGTPKSTPFHAPLVEVEGEEAARVLAIPAVQEALSS